MPKAKELLWFAIILILSNIAMLFKAEVNRYVLNPIGQDFVHPVWLWAESMATKIGYISQAQNGYAALDFLVPFIFILFPINLVCGIYLTVLEHRKQKQEISNVA